MNTIADSVTATTNHPGKAGGHSTSKGSATNLADLLFQSDQVDLSSLLSALWSGNAGLAKSQGVPAAVPVGGANQADPNASQNDAALTQAAILQAAMMQSPTVPVAAQPVAVPVKSGASQVGIIGPVQVGPQLAGVNPMEATAPQVLNQTANANEAIAANATPDTQPVTTGPAVKPAAELAAKANVAAASPNTASPNTAGPVADVEAAAPLADAPAADPVANVQAKVAAPAAEATLGAGAVAQATVKTAGGPILESSARTNGPARKADQANPIKSITAAAVKSGALSGAASPSTGSGSASGGDLAESAGSRIAASAKSASPSRNRIDSLLSDPSASVVFTQGSQRATAAEATAPMSAARQADGTPIANQIADAAAANAGRLGQQVVIRLDPPDLGEVRLTLHAKGQDVFGTIEVKNAATFNQLQGESSALVNRMADSGIHLRRMDVVLAEPAPTGNSSDPSSFLNRDNSYAQQQSSQSYDGQSQSGTGRQSSGGANYGPLMPEPTQGDLGGDARQLVSDSAVNIWI